MNVLDQLESEHREVEQMLEKLAHSEPGDERHETLQLLTESLTTHLAVEERFVYPITQEAVGAEEEAEAETEHDLARQGLDKLHELVDKPGFAAAVDMAKAGIKHHVEEEEHEVFPKLREQAGDRVDALGDPSELEQQVKSGGAGAGGATKEESGASKEELYEKAKEAGVAGRSRMSKSELKEALED
jgi:iron-sulfur cluster repair protein YtfE (RIC family)